LLIGEVCRRLGISPSTYWRLESNGTFPKAERWGDHPRPDMRVFQPARLNELKKRLRRHRSSGADA
jgi:DNA-binding transcriptional MerR regulator